jgi:hypothetical protein
MINSMTEADHVGEQCSRQLARFDLLLLETGDCYTYAAFSNTIDPESFVRDLTWE